MDLRGRWQVAVAVVLVATGTEAALADVPTLSLSELSAGSSKTFSLPRPGSWHRSFIVYAATDGAVPIEAVVVKLAEFQSNHAPVSALETAPKPVPLDGVARVIDRLHPAKFVIAARFLEPDTYGSSLFVFTPGQPPLVRDFTVQIGAPTAATPAITLKQIGPKEFSTRDEAMIVRLSIENDSDVQQVVGVHPGPRFVRRATGEPETDAGIGVAATNGTATVLPRETQEIAIELSRLCAGSEYTGEVRLSSPGATSIVLSAKVYVKRHWIWALLLIAAGVGLAFGIGWFRDHWRARQEMRRNLERIRQHLDSLLIELQSEIVRSVWHQLDEQGKRIDDDIIAGVATKAAIESYGDKTALFGDANLAALAIARLNNPAVQRDRRKALDEVLAIIASPNGDVAAGRKKLMAIDAVNAERDDLAVALAALVASVAEHIESGDPALTNDVVAKVNPEIATAEKAATADELAAMRAAIERARTALAIAGSSSIARYLVQAPPWADESAFKAFAEQLRPLAEAVTSAADYSAVRDKFVAGLVETTKQAADAVGLDTSALDAAVAAKDRSAVMRALRAVQALLEAKHSDVPPDARLVSVAGIASAHEIPDIQSSTLRPHAQRPPWQAIQARMVIADSAITLVVLLIAVSAGLKVLWFGNASWGNANDMLNAFLWGTGFKAGADVFVGITAMRTSLAKV